MGMFDSVTVPCPECKDDIIEFQSKAGPCELRNYPICEVPTEIAKDIDGDTACCRGCGHVARIRIAPLSVTTVQMGLE